MYTSCIYVYTRGDVTHVLISLELYLPYLRYDRLYGDGNFSDARLQKSGMQEPWIPKPGGYELS